MTQCNTNSGSDARRSQSVVRAANAVLAEHIKLILALAGIRAAVIQRDPLHLTAAIAEVIVATCDSAKALDALNRSLQTARGPDWDCPTCGEPVPSSFDLCWNCDTLHPLLGHDPHWAERATMDRIA